MQKWEVSVEGKVPTLTTPVFIEGLPGIANVGKIAVDFLIEELGAKKLYSFFSYNFPHSVFVNEQNLVDMPRLEIFYKKFKGAKQDLLLLTGDIQPIDEVSCYTFCEEILKLVKEHKCSEIVTTGGIGLSNIPEDPRVYVTGNDQNLLRKYTKLKSVERDIFGVVGPIVGVSGLLLGLGRKRKQKGVALLAETFGHPMYLGVKGAQQLISVFEQRFKYGLNLKRMNKEIIEVEKELMKKTKEWAVEMTSGSTPGAKPKSKDPSYIG